MGKLLLSVLVLVGIGIGVAHAQACPNGSSSVTIPLSGVATVVEYDQACNILPAANWQIVTPIAGTNTTLTDSTSPSVVASGSGSNFAAHGAVPGTAGTLTFTYVPNGKTFTMTYVVGGAVTSVSGGTTTP